MGFVVEFCGAKKDAFLDVHLEDLAPCREHFPVGAFVRIRQSGDLIAQLLDLAVHPLLLTLLQPFQARYLTSQPGEELCVGGNRNLYGSIAWSIAAGRGGGRSRPRGSGRACRARGRVGRGRVIEYSQV